MKTADFVVARRPKLSAILRFPSVDLSDYERRLADLQETLQRVQQAYLGTHERAVIVLEGWDTAGKGGVVRRLGWAPQLTIRDAVLRTLTWLQGNHWVLETRT